MYNPAKCCVNRCEVNLEIAQIHHRKYSYNIPIHIDPIPDIHPIALPLPHHLPIYLHTSKAQLMGLSLIYLS